MFESQKKDDKKSKLDIYYVPKNSKGYHCDTCKYRVEAGNGSYTCLFGVPKTIVKNGYVTDEYYWCNGRSFVSRY